MKLLSYLAFFVITIQASISFSQQQVIVGDTASVNVFGKELFRQSCSPQCNCYRCGTDHYNSDEFFVSSNLKENGGVKTLHVTHLFMPKSTGIKKDTLWIHDCPEFTLCQGGSGGVKYEYTLEGIDSMTSVRVVYTSVVQPIDTSTYQYLPKDIGAFFSMYNNVSDSSTFYNWQLIISDSAKLTFKIDTAGTELSSYLMEPYTRKRQLNFTFTTELTPVETERVFHAKLLTTVTTAGKDSVFENALLFRFSPLQPKGVRGITIDDAITVTILPNPTELNAVLSFGNNRGEAISIELYDALGNKRMTLADGIYECGVHTIPIDTKDLPQGSYFVRLQTSEQVVTKKLIVR